MLDRGILVANLGPVVDRKSLVQADPDQYASIDIS